MWILLSTVLTRGLFGHQHLEIYKQRPWPWLLVYLGRRATCTASSWPILYLSINLCDTGEDHALACWDALPGIRSSGSFQCPMGACLPTGQFLGTLITREPNLRTISSITRQQTEHKNFCVQSNCFAIQLIIYTSVSLEFCSDRGKQIQDLLHNKQIIKDLICSPNISKSDTHRCIWASMNVSTHYCLLCTCTCMAVNSLQRLLCISELNIAEKKISRHSLHLGCRHCPKKLSPALYMLYTLYSTAAKALQNICCLLIIFFVIIHG